MLEQSGSYWNQYTPTEPPVYRATDIDYVKWAAEGVELILWDVEGTLGERGSEELAFASAVEDAREANIPYHALHTNVPIRSKEDRRLLHAWGERTAADLILTPLDPTERKPSPVMTYKAMQHFEVEAAQAGVVDDKVSAGIRAGYFAGLTHRGWTRPFGANQHTGDRLVRTPLESLLRLRAHLLLTPVLQEKLKIDKATADHLAELPLNKIAELYERSQEPDNLDNIVGYGIEDIALSPQILRSIRQPLYRRALGEIKHAIDYYGESPAEKLKAFLYEHGRSTANSLTYARLAFAAGIVALNLSNMDPKNKQRITTGLVVLAQLTDVIDGPAARRHKKGATKKGGDEDREIDKILSAAIDVFALLPMEAIDKLNTEITLARDIGITALRKPFIARGIDATSIWSGKASTTTKAAAQFFGLAAGKRFPTANKTMQFTASGLKVVSMAHAPFVWIERHERARHEANNARRQLGTVALS
ncbi:MAG TPA: CDP-alcohol phosphatidyltransferase family protein [Candidatus Saccharimonadales bacterium]|nr:CDP-alcohol phosphatidyltransferase family protein [Candidatus Saccharimonadales bacterium]